MTTLKTQVIAMRKMLAESEEIKVLEQIKANCSQLFELNLTKSEFYIKFGNKLNLEIDEFGDLVLTVASVVKSDKFRERIATLIKNDKFFENCKVVNQAVEYINISF